MTLHHDGETPEEKAERLAEEKADRLFRKRLEAAAREQALARQAEADRVREAASILERADPMLIAEERYKKAVRGVPLYSNLGPPPGPSLGGLTTAQMEEIGRKAAAAERAWENEQNARERWVAGQADVVRNLTAGQSDENVRAIKAQFRAQKGGS